ncbi:unnamed protein product, partial [marine sediment metagenome]
ADPEFSVEGPSDVELIMGKKQVEDLYEVIKGLRTQELLMDSLSRIYSQYKRGFD